MRLNRQHLLMKTESQLYKTNVIIANVLAKIVHLWMIKKDLEISKQRTKQKRKR